jgi:hypothetical protein
MNVFGMKEVKVIKDKGVRPCGHGPKPDMKGSKLRVLKFVVLVQLQKGLWLAGQWRKT